MAFFRMCLDHLGGAYRDARMVAAFGDHSEAAIPDHWRRWFERIEVVWAHPVGADNPWYDAQHRVRFEIIRPDADLAVICDADVSILSDFDSLAQDVIRSDAIAAVIAHYHGWCEYSMGDPVKDWQDLSHEILGRPIELEHRYTLLNLDAPLQVPFYFNFGVMIGTPTALAAFHAKDQMLRPAVEAKVGRWWGPQVSAAFACAELDQSKLALPMRYNFPNDPIADANYPAELQNIVFVHYLRKDQFDRQKIFASRDGFDALLAMDLTGSNAVFQQHIARVTGGVYPFANRDPG
jgi:hypothetical protein